MQPSEIFLSERYYHHSGITVFLLLFLSRVLFSIKPRNVLIMLTAAAVWLRFVNQQHSQYYSLDDGRPEILQPPLVCV